MNCIAVLGEMNLVGMADFGVDNHKYVEVKNHIYP